MMVTMSHDQAFYLLNDAREWVMTNRDQYDIKEFAEMIKQFSNEPTNDYELICNYNRRKFLKTIPTQFYKDSFEL